jgi:hypothetical protein
MKTLLGISIIAILLAAQVSAADNAVPIRQSPPLPRGQGLGTMPYKPLEDETPFIEKITEREIKLWKDVKMPKASNMSDKEWEKLQKKSREITEKQIPIDQYELAKQAGEYVGWFGIVRSLNFDAKK